MAPSHVLHSLSLLTFSTSIIQDHSLFLTTPSVIPPLFLPPVCVDFLTSTNFLPIPAKLVQKIRRWEFVELNQLLPDNLVSFLNLDSELGDQKLPRERKKVSSIEDIVFGNVAVHSKDWGDDSLHGQYSRNQHQLSG